VLGLVAFIALRPAAKETPAAPAPAKSVVETKPATSTPVVSDKSIAVLPFANMSDEKDSAFFSDGIQEDVLTNLGSVRDLHVVSRTSVEQYRKTTKPIRQIGEELRVAYVLEGSVRRAGGKVRVTGQLIHAATDEHVWAKSYDRDITDIFAVQTELAHDIAGALSAVLSPQEKATLARRPTENVAAYELYLKAREWREKKSGSGRVTAAVSLLQQAVELDPKFAVAWAELGDCHAQLVFDEYDRTEQRLASARAAIETAVRLAADDPGVIAKLGAYYFHADRDYARATEQYVRLAQLRPNDPEVLGALGDIQARQGRWTEAVANLRHVLELDPGNFGQTRAFVVLLEAGHRYNEAEALARRLVKAFPEEQDGYFWLASVAFQARGSTAEMEAMSQRTFDPDRRSAVGYAKKILARFRGDTAEAIRLDREQPVWDGGESPWAQEMAAAITLMNAGDFTAARARLTTTLAVMNEKKEKEPLNSWLFAWLGQAHALLGEKAEALACAQRSLEILPESRDAMYGVENAVMAVSTYAWVGEKDHALAEFARLLKTPHGTNIFTAPRGSNRRDTQVSFKPLWDDPRFKALVADPKNNAPLF
jgi:TolB-like protein/Flp pilus assembly protein TadD